MSTFFGYIRLLRRSTGLLVLISAVMKNKKRNSKEWLKYRRDVIKSWRRWLLLAVAKIFLVAFFIISVRFFFIGKESDSSLARSIALLLLLHLLILGIVIKEFHLAQLLEQYAVSEWLTGDDTFHCLEIIPGKAFRIHFRENRIYKQRIRRFKRIIRKSRRRNIGG